MPSPGPTSTLAGLRAEIQAALEVIVPQIAGLDDLSLVSLSPATLDAVNAERARHSHRRDLLRAVLAALDALENAIRDLLADGYPAVPPSEVRFEIFQELQRQLDELLKAFEQFRPEAPAAKITATLGQPQDKPPSGPS